MVPITVGTWYLLLRATFCVSANLTTNELLNRARYCYLKVGSTQPNMRNHAGGTFMGRTWHRNEEVMRGGCEMSNQETALGFLGSLELRICRPRIDGNIMCILRCVEQPRGSPDVAREADASRCIGHCV